MSDNLRAIDVHGFGGGFTLGAVQAGFELVAKKGREVGFGVLNVLANRQLLPGDWEVESGAPSMWVPQPANLVLGNPPCSGFSTLSPAAFRGQDSAINECMWELVRYGGRVAPEMIVFESVQQAFTQGRELMRALRTEVERISGRQYKLVHVLHNNAATGGASLRRRYFWCAVRDDVEFGVEANATRYDFYKKTIEQYELTRVPTFHDILSDLKPLNLTMHAQPYRGVQCACRPAGESELECTCRQPTVATASWWTRNHMHDGSGIVDGQDVFRSPTFMRILEMLELSKQDGAPWLEGERMSDVLRRYHHRHNELPETWHYMSRKPMLTTDGMPMVNDDGKPMYTPIRKDARLLETDFAMGHNQPSRWRGGRMARVITGGAVHLIVHPTEDRTLTHREAARIQGFPDAWKIWPVRYAADLGPGWGKGVPVHAGRWIADWAYRSISGEPGSIQGEPDKLSLEREVVINLTNRYKPFSKVIGDPG